MAVRLHRGSILTALLAGVLVVGAACAPPPPTGPPAPPGPPVIDSFTSVSQRTEAPVLTTLGWRITDPNNDVLVCRVDTDGDGTVDKEIVPCSSASSVLAQFDTAGTRTATLEVSDGSFPPVTTQVEIPVTAGPTETFDITLRLAPGMRPEFAQAFQNAAARWESVIAAGVPDQRLDLIAGLFGWVPAFNGIVDDVLIDARDSAIDGPGKVLGRAGALLVRQPQWLPYYGFMEFDTADLDALDASGRLGDVILHEMGHVLGLGTSWLLTGAIADPLTNPAYTGPAGIAAYQELGGRRFVPVENEGGLGTVFGHWRESVFGDELMTGFLGNQPTKMSRLTIAALADQGYGVDLSAADAYSLPLPSAAQRSAELSVDDLHTEQVGPFLDGLPDPLPTAP